MTKCTPPTPPVSDYCGDKDCTFVGKVEQLTRERDEACGKFCDLEYERDLLKDERDEWKRRAEEAEAKLAKMRI
jgi:hypothetical protein